MYHINFSNALDPRDIHPKHIFLEVLGNIYFEFTNYKSESNSSEQNQDFLGDTRLVKSGKKNLYLVTFSIFLLSFEQILEKFLHFLLHKTFENAQFRKNFVKKSLVIQSVHHHA